MIKNTTWIQARWLTNENCLSAPSSLVSLTLPDRKTNLNEFLAANRSFPDKNFQYHIYPYTTCGTVPVDLESNQYCCGSSLEGSAKTSLSNILVGDKSAEYYIPAAANGFSYCRLTHTPENSTASVFQYNSIMVRNDGSCNSISVYNNSETSDISLSCSTAGILSVYSERNCINSASSVFSTEMLKYDQGSMNTGWVEFVPGCKILIITFLTLSLNIGALRPAYENAVEIVALASCILAIILFSIFIKVTLYKWKARRQISDILLAADFSMWLVTVILRIVYENAIFYDPGEVINTALPLGATRPEQLSLKNLNDPGEDINTALPLGATHLSLNKRAKGSENSIADPTKNRRPGGSMINFSTGTSRTSAACLSNTCGLSQDLISFFLYISTFLSFGIFTRIGFLIISNVSTSFPLLFSQSNILLTYSGSLQS